MINTRANSTLFERNLNVAPLNYRGGVWAEDYIPVIP